MAGFGAGQQFSEKDLAAAKLPPPPEEDSQLEVLLRPGLLADVEIIVERIPNAIHIPAQAVFDLGDGRSTVFVKEGNRFVARVVKPLKRSESTMVIADGLKPGEEIALANPDAKPTGGKKSNKGGSGGPMIPSGKGA
jgi:multidrug efflux pump subunit AcrA (membrane-fusion protein)